MESCGGVGEMEEGLRELLFKGRPTEEEKIHACEKGQRRCCMLDRCSPLVPRACQSFDVIFL